MYNRGQRGPGLKRPLHISMGMEGHRGRTCIGVSHNIQYLTYSELVLERKVSSLTVSYGRMGRSATVLNID
jgi:hypothetical protein